jgi:PTH1 family peptidyl-tRNA hydrolase
MEKSVALESPLLIVGLGNPGPDYVRTRHNTGWQVIDLLAKKLGLEWRQSRAGQIAEGLVGERRIQLLKPQTFMNLSGQAVAQALGGRDLTDGNVLVIYDDVEVNLGSWRVRLGGGHAGHNGIKSIIELVGANFLRVRVGVGPVPEHLGVGADRDLDKFVLARFTETEEKQLLSLLDDLVSNLIESVGSGQITLATQHSN